MEDCNWTALERFTALMGTTPIPTNPLGVTNINADDFMYMGVAYADPTASYRNMGPMVFLYKHCDTRRYLNLDGAGHAYRYSGKDNRYYPHTNAIDALNWVVS